MKPAHPTEPAIPAPLDDLLSLYLDEEEGEGALRRAADWARGNPVDIADLLDWVQRYAASRERKARAQVVLRSALGLALVPGAVCRPLPKD